MGEENLKSKKDELERQQRVEELMNSTLADFEEASVIADYNVDDLVKTREEAFEDYKQKFKESKKVIFPKVKPVGQTILTTATLMNIMEQKVQLIGEDFDMNLIETLKNSVSDVQTVVATGPNCTQLKVGDVVKIRFSDFTRIENPNSVHSKEVFDLPVEKVNGINYLEMHERNVKFVYIKEE